MLDISTRLCPFISHNNSAKMQMEASQHKQIIPLIHAEQPYIRSGFEEQFLHYSSYLFVAKDNGKVIYKDDNILIVKYDNNNGEIINLNSLYGNKEGFDKMLFTKLNLDDRFNKGDILAYHSTINEKGFLTLGVNLKTTYISHPYNFKDALIVSESCAQKMSTRIVYEETIDCTDKIPILWNDNNISYPQGTYVNNAQTIFIMKERVPLNPTNIVSTGEEIISPVSGKLYYSLKIDEVVKTKNEENYYNKLYQEEITKETLISEKIKEIYDMDNATESLEASAYINYYCPQLNKRRTGKSIVLKYWIVQECPLMIGCKLANRHGNKGVVSKIFEDKDMPKDQYGDIIDIIVSSMSVTTRMNVGQLFEMHMNRANYLYCKNNLYNPNDSNTDKMNKLYNMISYAQPNYINDIFKDFINSSTEEEKDDFIKEVMKDNIVQIVHPPFTKFNYDDCLLFCQKFGNMDKDLKEQLTFDNEEIRAPFGHTYWYRLEHEPNKKYFARSVGLYGKIGQPSRNNGSNKGAHRIGEMEVWSILANQLYENLLEMMITKSDNISEAARMLKYLYDGCSHRYTPFNTTPGILKVFETFVNAAGYEMKNIELDEDGNIIDDKENSISVLSSINSNNSKYINLDVSKEMEVLTK